MTVTHTAGADYYGTHPCSLARTLRVVGERWTLLILREAIAGTTRFSDFRATLGVTSEVLSTRLALLVDAGVMGRRSYREDGCRVRESYHLSESGRELKLVLAALQHWADAHTPGDLDPRLVFTGPAGEAVTVGFMDSRRGQLPAESVDLVRIDGPASLSH